MAESGGNGEIPTKEQDFSIPKKIDRRTLIGGGLAGIAGFGLAKIPGIRDESSSNAEGTPAAPAQKEAAYTPEEKRVLTEEVLPAVRQVINELASDEIRTGNGLELFKEGSEDKLIAMHDLLYTGAEPSKEWVAQDGFGYAITENDEYKTREIQVGLVQTGQDRVSIQIILDPSNGSLLDKKLVLSNLNLDEYRASKEDLMGNLGRIFNLPPDVWNDGTMSLTTTERSDQPTRIQSLNYDKSDGDGSGLTVSAEDHSVGDYSYTSEVYDYSNFKFPDPKK